jgi:hypothetical protein
MRRTMRTAVFCGVAWFGLAMVAPASACPMCKLANETSSRLPRAYMCSILFMLGMPVTLTAGFGIGFYRLSRKAAEMQAAEAERWRMSADESRDATDSVDPRNDPPTFA